jgi:hypothetical protein
VGHETAPEQVSTAANQFDPLNSVGELRYAPLHQRPKSPSEPRSREDRNDSGDCGQHASAE